MKLCLGLYRFLVMFSVVFTLVSCTGMRSRYHSVDEGETLQEIARQYEVTVRELKNANGGLKRGLKAGSKLYIPFETNPKWHADPQSIIAEAEADAAGTEGKSNGRTPNSLPPASEVLGAKFKWPVRGTVSSAFGSRRGSMHEGIDIAAPRGTRVVASRAGHVIYSDNKISGYGKMIIIQHTDSFATVYAHLSKSNVKRGQFVARGQLLGRVGSTGHATGPHLHFEVRNNRFARDPLQYLPGQYAMR